MGRVALEQNSFNAGIFSRLLRFRTDFAKYKNASSGLQNFIPLQQGAIIRRSGTMFVAEVKNSANTARLLEFEFNEAQAYVVELGVGYTRFFRDYGAVLSAGVPYEIANPYAASNILLAIKYDQSADVMTLCHPGYAPQSLSRLADTNWTLAPTAFDPPPFGAINILPTTITVSAVTGAAVSMTASAALFTTGHVGAEWKFIENLASKYDKWVTAQAVIIGARRIYDSRLYEATTAGTTGTRPPVHEIGTESDGTVSWQYLHDGSGRIRLDTYINSTSATGTVVSRLPDSALTPGTANWYLTSWCDQLGWPACSTYYQDRHFFAQNQTVFGSVTGDYPSFAIKKDGTGAVLDESALQFTLLDTKPSIAKWMISVSRGLLVGTTSMEFLLSATAAGEGITPRNAKRQRITSHGSSDVRPVASNDACVFLQRAGKKLMELAYVFERDGYNAPDMTLLVRGLTDLGIVDIAYQRQPNNIIWGVRGDGRLLGFTYNRDEDVLAWHEHIIGGFSNDAKTLPAVVESVAVIPSPDSTRDDLWMIVRRRINGQTKRYIEVLQKEWDGTIQPREDVWFSDCALQYKGAAASVISGLGHLEGEVVRITADGSLHPDRTVVAGSVTLDAAYTTVLIGLKTEAKWTSLPVEGGAEDGSSHPKTKKISQNTVAFLQTLGGKYGTTALADSEYSPFIYPAGDPMDAAQPLFDGKIQIVWPGTFDYSVDMVISTDDPLPMTICGIYPNVEANDM